MRTSIWAKLKNNVSKSSSKVRNLPQNKINYFWVQLLKNMLFSFTFFDHHSIYLFWKEIQIKLSWYGWGINISKKVKKDFMVHTLKLNIKIKLCNKRWKTKWRSYVTKEFRLSRELYAKFQSSARIPSKSSQRSKLLNIRIKVHQRQKILKTAMTQRHWACWT